MLQQEASMWTMFGILKPGEAGHRHLAAGPVPIVQKPFFSGPEASDRTARAEADAGLLKGHPALDDRDAGAPEDTRFVTYFVPPYF